MARYQETVDFLNPDSSAFRKTRLPRPAPADDNADSVPGKLCWGEAGTMPTAELAETVGFEVVKDNEVWTETSRTAHDEEIVNPDDPDSKVVVNRPDKILYNRKSTTYGLAPNDSITTPDFGGFEASPIELTAFTPLGYEHHKKSKVQVTVTNGPRAA